MARAKINPPTREVTDPNYSAECRIALEASFQSLTDKAVEAGWGPQAVAYTLMVLAARQLELQSQSAEDQPAGEPLAASESAETT